MTKKKKGAILISALALIAVIVIGGTLAYFTDQDDAKNVFTLGKVQGDLTEDTKDYEVDTPGGGTHPVKPGTLTEDGISYDKIVPGDWLSKEPRVSLTGDSEDAYVRVRLSVPNSTKLNQEQVAELITAKCLNFGEKWVVGVDGYIYYQEKLTRDSSGKSQTDPVFTMVKIPEEWGNSTAEASFEITIQADLVQAENFETSLGHNAAGQIDSWVGVTIEKAAQ